MEATRIRLAEGVHLTYLPARKFKTSLLSAQFVTPLRRETAGANALLAAVLRRGTVSCPDMGALSAKMDNLYDASIDYTVRKKGENQCVGFVASFIDDRYAPGGERLLEPAAALLGAEGEMLDYAVRYGRLLMICLPFFILQNMFQSFFVTAEKPHLGFAFTVAAGVTNMVLDVVLVGMLHGGVEGAAIATFISQAVGGVLPVFYFLNKRSTSSIHLGRAQWNGGVIRSACINGSSELMTNLSMSLVNILYNFQLLRFAGENGVAAYGVIMYAAFLFVAVFVGYAVGSAPIVSYHYGARNHAELNNLYSKSLRLIGVIAVVMTALSMLVIPYVARIFVGYDAELLALTSHAFRVYALNFFLMGFNVYGSSFFTALGDGVTSALISFLRTLLFQLLALILLPMVLGIEGVWLAVTAAEAGALCVTVLMFITKDKVFHYRKASC